MITKIKAASLVARKGRDPIKGDLLKTVIAEIEKKAKDDGQREVIDSDCLSVLKKFKKNIEDNIKLIPVTDNTFHKRAGYELLILNSFLPVEMTENELNVAIEVIISDNSFSSMKDMGKVMKVLKDQYDGLYNGSLASKIVKEKLS